MSRRKNRIASAGVVMSFVAATSEEGSAATVEYDFEAEITSGDYSGNTYTGSFSFDDESAPRASDATYDYYTLTDFEFSFEGRDCDPSDILDYNDPGVRFDGDSFAGLGGVDTGEGGGLTLRATGIGPEYGHGPNQQQTIEGSVIRGYDSNVSTQLQGTVTYQVPEPGQALMFPVALLSLASGKLASKLRAAGRSARRKRS